MHIDEVVGEVSEVQSIRGKLEEMSGIG